MLPMIDLPKSKPSEMDILEFKKAIYTNDHRMIKLFYDQGFPTDTSSIPCNWEENSNELLSILGHINQRTLKVFYLLLNEGINIHHKDEYGNNALVYIFDFLYQLREDEDSFQEYSEELKLSAYDIPKEMFDVLMERNISLKLGFTSEEITDIFEWSVLIDTYSWFKPYKHNFSKEELYLYESKRLKNLVNSKIP